MRRKIGNSQFKIRQVTKAKRSAIVAEKTKTGKKVPSPHTLPPSSSRKKRTTVEDLDETKEDSSFEAENSGKSTTSDTKRRSNKPIISTSKEALAEERRRALEILAERKENQRKKEEARRNKPAPPPDPDAIIRRGFQSREVTARKKTEESATIRDIYYVPEFSSFTPINFQGINWERRLACKNDPVLDLKTYFAPTFYLDFADFHYSLIYEIDQRLKYGGRKAMALPRGSGKTAICRAMTIRATKFGLRNFAFFIGSKEDKAIQTLEWIKTHWFRNKLLFQDFPEIAYPVYRLEGRATAGSQGQIYRNERTHIIWGGREIQYPTLLLSQEDAQTYLDNDPSCVKYLEEYDRYIINSGGVLIRVAGIDGSIRGEADIHPILLTQPRPDFVLLDDVQKDQGAKSPAICEELEKLIESAIEHLSAPDVEQACLMPCTVIREGDVSDHYLNPDLKPEWSGERHGLVRKFPRCIDYDHIYDEINGVPNEQGKAWLDYKEIREQSYRKFRNLKLANEFYLEHRELLEQDFEPSWPDRFKRTEGAPDDNNEVSALQSLMNWRFKDHLAYLSEGENRPRQQLSAGSIVVSAEEIREKVTAVTRGELTVQWTNVVSFIDVSDEILYWMIFAHDSDFNGQIIDYGTYPQVTVPVFRKFQTAGWSLLTRDFYRHHPKQAPPGINRDRNTKERAPFDAKIYHALTQCTQYLSSREFPTGDDRMPTRRIRAMAIDTKWGQASDVIKRWVREQGKDRIKAYEGHPYMPSYKQLEEYDATPGWLFEHQQFPHVAESKWVIKPYNKRGYQQTYIQADVNRWKSFLMKRLGTPMGARGCITLYNAAPEHHQMVAAHLSAEFPEPVSARGITKDVWKTREGFTTDNDWLDCAVGCLCLASICGASIKSEGTDKPPGPRNLKEIYQQKKQATGVQ